MADAVLTKPFEIDDFSGGMTDNYIAGRPNQFQTADNFFLKKYGAKGKLFTAPGSAIYDDDYFQIPTEVRLSGLVDSEGALFQISCPNVYTIDSGWDEVEGPTGNNCFSAGTAASNYASWAKWNKHLLLVNDAFAQPQKVYNDGVGWVSRTLGLPSITTSGITITPTAGAQSFIYTFLRADSYTIGSVTFREVSATSSKSVSSAAAPNVSTIAITNIPVLSNGGTGNYNTATSTIEIYRTTNGGTTSYYVGQVTNGTTSFNDTVSDATLITNAALYTEGGVVDYEQVDPAKYVLVSDDVAFYLNVKEDSVTYGNRVRQSIPGSLFSSPRSFYVDLAADIIGGVVINGYPVVFCENRKIYRIEGRFDSLGQGGMVAKELKDPVELVSHRSIVHTPQCVFFAATDGFYRTDGFIIDQPEGSKDIPDSFAELVASSTQKARLYGAYDYKERRIWFAGQRDGGSQDNDIVFVAHLDAPNVPFTTLSGGELVDNFAPSSLLFFNGYMLQGDRRGYLFQHGMPNLTRPLIDVDLDPDEWGEQTIEYDYRSCAFDFGTTQVRKWVPRIVVNADNSTNLSMQVSTNVDNTGTFNETSEIKFRGNSPWGDDDGPVWGSDQIRWNYATTINHWRRLPSPIRCSYRQVRMTNSHTEIESSVELGTSSTDGTTKVIQLDDVTKAFSNNIVGYFISFDSDDYLREFEVIERTSDTEIVVEDTLNNLSSAVGRNWIVKGKKKNELLNLLSYSLDVGYISMSQTTSRTQEA